MVKQLEQWHTSIDALRWAWRFYVGHLPLVLGLGAIAATERAVSQFWDEPTGARMLLEAVTWGARLVLVIVAVRVGILTAPHYRRDAVDPRMTRFIHDRWPSLVFDGLILSVAFTVFSLPEWLAPALTGTAEEAYVAVVLGIKNLTVIPLTFVWMVGVARQAVLYQRQPPPSGTLANAPTADRSGS